MQKPRAWLAYSADTKQRRYNGGLNKLCGDAWADSTWVGLGDGLAVVDGLHDKREERNIGHVGGIRVRGTATACE